MVTETVENPITPEAPSELPESPSEPVEFTPSEEPDAEQTAVSTDEPTEEASDDVEAEPEPPVPTVESALDKRAAIDRGDTSVTLSAEEFRLLREHDRAESNRQRDFERNEAERQKQVQELEAQFDQAGTMIVDETFKLADWLNRFGASDDPVTRENVQTRINGLVNLLRNNATSIVMEPHLERQRSMLRSAYGEAVSPETTRAISGLKSQEQILGWAYEMGRAYGQGESAPSDKVLVDKKDYERWTKAEKINAKAGEASSVPPTSRPSPRDSRSDDEILMDPATPIEKLIEIRSRQQGGG